MIFLAGLPLFCKFSGQNQVSVSAISKKNLRLKAGQSGILENVVEKI